DAVEDKTVNDFSDDIYEEVPAVNPDAVIEEILQDTMSCEYSLPVVDEEGNLKGELERSAVADIFAEPGETETDPKPVIDKAS
ncbi:glycine betaine/L-proline ABC transporter ATP-binding protein, partial [Vibrio fortis]